MSINPYESPRSYPSSLATFTASHVDSGFRVDGNLLIVRSGAVLPPVCVKTNQRVSHRDVVSKRFTWCSPIVGLLIVLSGLVLILVYFLVRKHCTITFGLHADVRRKYRNRCLVKVLAAVVLFFMLPFVSAVDSGPLIAVVFVLFLAAVVSLFIGNSPLTVKGYHNGEFWLAGCCREFLADVDPDAAR